MKKYSLPGKIWRIVYPSLILLGIQATVIIFAITAYIIYKFYTMALSQNISNLIDQELTVQALNYVFMPSIAVYAIVSSILLFFVFKREIKYLPENPQKFKPSVYVVFFIFGICLNILITFLIAILRVEQFFPEHDQFVALMTDKKNIFINLIAVGICGPIAEEFCFRGLIFKRARTHFGLSAAIIISSALFGIIHGNWLQGIYAGAFGIVLAFVYHYSGKIIAPILIHVGFNTLSVLSSLIPEGYEFVLGILFFVGLCLAVVLSVIIFKKIPFWKYKKTGETPPVF
ncbi:MAG: CPBP family intramembrane metalloprotease [Eubacterium sp.]|jgi:membrane protease YdiL (CAAX protease family)|nr:CPBP family intramembrane metalloprotease [Eubacterium sp.]